MKFLVPVDFSEITNPLLRTVKRVGEKVDCEVHLLHVIPPVLYLPYPETMGVSVIDIELLEKLEDEKKAEAKEKLKALEEFLKPVKARSHVDVGDPADVILDYEEKLNPDMVFLGGHKKGLIEKLLIGSTTEKVVKHGKKSDFVIKGSEVEFRKKVVIAYDFSKTAQKTAEFALKFLKNFKVSVEIVHVHESIEMPLIEKLKHKIEKEFSEEKKKILNELKGRFEEEGIKTEVKFLEGEDAVDVISSYVNETPEVELLIIGSKGLSGLKKLILGRTATKLLGKVNKPILIYKVQE
ncbi:universal stress protein [Aquifex aeolicus]|nr:universal stress protein [Aquifex aeolicus]